MSLTRQRFRLAKTYTNRSGDSDRKTYIDLTDWIVRLRPNPAFDRRRGVLQT